MIPLQQISCSPEQFDTLAKIYAGSDIHELRQRGHAIILRHKGYNLDEISSVLGRNNRDIVIIIKSFFYFGFEGLNNLDYEYLLSKILEIEEPPTQESNNNVWQLLNSLFEPIIKYLTIFFVGLLSFRGFEFIANSPSGKYLPLFVLIIPLLFFVWIFRWLSSSFFFKTKLNNQSAGNAARNSLNFIGSSNVINQFVFNLNGEISHLDNTSLFNSAISKAAESNEEIKSNDYRITALIKFAKKFDKNSIIRKLLILIGGSAIYWSIKYSASVKAGILIVAWFSIRFTMTLLPENETIEIQKSSSDKKIVISADSINSTVNTQSKEVDYDFSKMPVSSEHEYLMNMDEEAKWFISRDSIEYEYEYYIINEKDERAYLQVAYYHNVRFAAIQRKNLIENHNFNSSDCQILCFNYKGKQCYGVTIGNSPRDNIEELSKIQNGWNQKAKSANVRAYLKTN